MQRSRWPSRSRRRATTAQARSRTPACTPWPRPGRASTSRWVISRTTRRTEASSAGAVPSSRGSPMSKSSRATTTRANRPQAAPLARFIMIAPGVRGSLNIDYSATGPGYAFTRDAIDSARAAGIKWIVVGMHKNCISVGDKACEIGTALMNLLIEKRVDLVLQSHDHNYQRSHALSCVTVGSVNPDCIADDGSDGLYAKGAGPVVLINGEFGRPLYPVNPSDSEAGYFAKSDATTFGITRYHVTETSITADYIGSGGGTNADSFTIAEIVGAPPPSRTTLSVVPSDDAMIVAASPTTNFGSGTSLGVDSSPVEHSLMKFDVTGIGSRRVVSAKLRVRS